MKNLRWWKGLWRVLRNGELRDAIEGCVNRNQAAQAAREFDKAFEMEPDLDPHEEYTRLERKRKVARVCRRPIDS